MDFLTQLNLTPSEIIPAMIFYSLAILIIIGAILVVTLRNLFHSIITLAAVLFFIAGVYLLLNAEFLALTQILIYVGAIVTLIIFVVMLTARVGSPLIRQTNEQKLVSFIVCLALAVVLIIILVLTPWKSLYGETNLANITKLGEALLTLYVFPFEIISIILLIALIGAIILARKEIDSLGVKSNDKIQMANKSVNHRT
ncbi:MAG: NADH-quinone oxidoreductase subunit J [bacterium]|nr:NADH-quinone oxidoreductase subunit J [bacterium]